MPLTRPGQAPAAVVGGRVLERRPLMGDPPPEVPRHPNKDDKRPWIRAVGDPDPAPETVIGPNGYRVLADSGDRRRGEYYTRASSLGGCLEDQFNLTAWKMWVCTVGAAYNRSVQIDAKTYDPEDRGLRKDLSGRAFESGGGNDAARAGTAMHTVCDGIDRGEDVPSDETWDRAVAAYREAISRFRVHAIELFLVNDRLKSSGTTDRLVSPLWPMEAPDGTTISPSDRLVWDLKTAQSAHFFGVKFAAQLGAYAGGLPYRHDQGRTPWDVVPRQDWGLVLHLPSGGDTAQLWWVDLSPQPMDLPAEPTPGEVAVFVRDLRKRKYFYKAELPSEGTPAALDELGFARLLRDAQTPGEVAFLVEHHRSSMSEAQLAAARARWAELSKPGPGAA